MIYQGFSHFEGGHVKSERALTRSISQEKPLILHAPSFKMAETLFIECKDAQPFSFLLWANSEQLIRPTLVDFCLRMCYIYSHMARFTRSISAVTGAPAFSRLSSLQDKSMVRGQW